MDWVPRDKDKSTAWELYVEMITRVATQSLAPAQGQESASLQSVYQLFPLTRDIIKRNGRHCINFSKIAVVVLSQLVRPFTTNWHVHLASDAVLSEDQRIQFRVELIQLQTDLRKYTRLLADLADVEDLTDLEADD